MNPASSDRSEPDYTFDFCGGHLAIDFTNTVGSRGDAPVEHLNTLGDIVAWAGARGVIAESEAAALKKTAAAAPEKARRAVRDVRELREALYEVFKAIAERRRPRAAALERLNRAVAETYASAILAPSGKRFALDTRTGDGLDRVI